MIRIGLVTGALVGALLVTPVLGLMFLAHELWDFPFPPYDLFDWATRILPGGLVTFGIDLMVETLLLLGISVADMAKTAEKVIAVVQFFVGGIVVGAIFFEITRRRNARPDLWSELIVGAIVGLPIITISIYIGESEREPLLSILWLMTIFLGWSVALEKTSSHLNPPDSVVSLPEGQANVVERINRRQFLVRLGGTTATITVASTLLGNILAAAARREVENELSKSVVQEGSDSTRRLLPNSSDPLMPAPGTRPEYTPVEDHYQVFIRLEPTVINGASWVLPFMGAVANPLALTIDDIRNNYQPRDQYVTLSCISGRIGTDLISTTRWTGVSVQDILADVKPNENARYLYITSGDGFYETVGLDLIASDERIMLAYAWDGNPIPIDHGFPLRIWLPDRFGMKQPKWITGIEVTDEYRQGYWVERGWDEMAQVQTTSVIDTVAVDAVYRRDGWPMVPVGGIAFAGDRGISRVEIRVDGGPWEEAMLRTPLSDTTWVIWRFDWPFQEGSHEFEVRGTELDGTTQFEERRGNRPSGARGIHSKNANL